MCAADRAIRSDAGLAARRFALLCCPNLNGERGRARCTRYLRSAVLCRCDRGRIGSGHKHQTVPSRAELDHDRLHAGLQLHRGYVPSRVRGARFGADRCCDHRQQCHGEHLVPDELLHPAAQLSNQLRPRVAIAVSERTSASAQLGNRLGNRIERLFGGCAPDRNGLGGAMEFEPTDVADARRDMNIGRIAGKPHASEAVLHDVE
jgi:hypothetical protein